jgi:predicted hydrocarbon binding protein
MKRNEFLKTCGAGLCGCGVMGLLAPLAASARVVDGQTTAAPSELDLLKRQIDEAHERFAKLVAIMGEDLDGAVRDKILMRLGRECAKAYRPLFEKYRGNLSGFHEKIKTAWLESAAYDEKTGVLRVAGKPAPCGCPLVKAGRTPTDFCVCSAGWQQEAYSIVLNKPVAVEIEETVLRGGKRCSFRIAVQEEIK